MHRRKGSEMRRERYLGTSAVSGSSSQLERTPPGAANLVDVLDRVLDKGIVIDAWVGVSLIGIELVTVEARVVVASIATYLGYADALTELKTPHFLKHTYRAGPFERRGAGRAPSQLLDVPMHASGEGPGRPEADPSVY
jgi:hypothetical protein